MKRFWKTKNGKITAAVLSLLLVAALAFGGFTFWLYQQPKFQDVTVELGTQTLSLSQFTTKYADLAKCSFASDVSAIQLGQAGTYPLTLSYGSQTQTVNLIIQDTTAPKATFHTELIKSPGYVPQAMDFVESFSDFSETTVLFAADPALGEDYEDVEVDVIVRDAAGNETKQTCILRFQWLHPEITLEMGQTLTKEMILLDPQDADLIDQADIDAINASPVGEYTIVSTSATKTEECKVTIQDTQGPVLTLKDHLIAPGTAVSVRDFVEECSDGSGNVELTLLTQLDLETLGRTTIQIEAKDAYGNVTRKEATLMVTNDMEAPTLEGLTELTLEKHSEPDFLDGITAKDNSEEAVEITVDTSKLDMTKAGTYFLTYTATDTSGNQTTGRRKVTVEHDEADTKLLVAEIAAGLENDPEKLRDYVRGKIGYNSNWGGDDPVWYGFKNKAGNCYVHALCLDALLKYYGYETQIIWVKDKSHYWLLINLEGVGWRHIDPTPSEVHGRYSLMTDAQRKSTLDGRTWDTTIWPAAEELPVETTPPTEVPEETTIPTETANND